MTSDPPLCLLLALFGIGPIVLCLLVALVDLIREIHRTRR